jgi:hypothetical protein
MNGTTSLSSGLLCVRYRRLGDRLAHEIGTIDGDSFYPVLESIEGTPVDAWPVSPPMQQIVEESMGASLSPVLLGVGLSGNGHWSIAIESQNASSLKFDVACKNSKPSLWFGSKYRVSTEWVVANAIISQIELIHSKPEFVPTRLQLLATIGQLRYDESDRTIAIVPASDPGKMLTHRWCYRIGIG